MKYFLQGQIENEGTFRYLSESDNLYAKLLTAEPEPTDEERLKQIENVKIIRKMSIRVSDFLFYKTLKLKRFFFVFRVPSHL